MSRAREQHDKDDRWVYLSIPAPLKRVFDRFPLRTYPRSALPLGSPKPAPAVFYSFTTSEDALYGRPSFNPTCLRWQTYLRFHGVEVIVRPSNNHASPSGSLPFLLTFASSSSAQQTAFSSSTQQTTQSPDATQPGNATHSGTKTISTSGIPEWLQSRATRGPEHLADPEPARLRPYTALLTRSVRLAYLWALYDDVAVFDRVAAPLYIRPCSSNWLVRDALAYPLRVAAWEQVLIGTRPEGVAAGEIDGEGVLREAGIALDALSVFLGDNDWFLAAAAEGQKGPAMFDALVFSYTHVILHYFTGVDPESPAARLRAMIERKRNLVGHRQRVLDTFYP